MSYPARAVVGGKYGYIERNVIDIYEKNIIDRSRERERERGGESAVDR